MSHFIIRSNILSAPVFGEGGERKSGDQEGSPDFQRGWGKQRESLGS